MQGVTNGNSKHAANSAWKQGTPYVLAPIFHLSKFKLLPIINALLIFLIHLLQKPITGCYGFYAETSAKKRRE